MKGERFETRLEFEKDGKIDVISNINVLKDNGCRSEEHQKNNRDF